MSDVTFLAELWKFQIVEARLAKASLLQSRHALLEYKTYHVMCYRSGSKIIPARPCKFVDLRFNLEKWDCITQDETNAFDFDYNRVISYRLC